MPESHGTGAPDGARRELLEEVRRHLAASKAAGAEPPGEMPVPSADETASSSVAGGAELVDCFRRSVEGVAGRCVVVADLAGASRAVRAVLDRHRPRRLALSDSPLVRRVVEAAGPDAEVIVDGDARALFGVDVGITAAQWAVADTGTLVLDADAERHRLASLVPPVHVAIVAAAQVRPTIGDVLLELERRGRDGLGRCVTFITGPSRTSDIELTLAIGVHGPGTLHVIVIEDVPAGA